MAEESRQQFPSNIPIPDPSIATVAGLSTLRSEVRSWVDSLQLLHESKIDSSVTLLIEKISGAEDKTANLDRVVQTRLAGSETALNAAMAAADKVTQEIKLNFGAVVNELKSGMTKQIDACNEKIEDLKKRVFESGGRLESTKDHRDDERHRSQNQIAMIAAAIAAIGILIALGGIIYTATRSPTVVYAQPVGAFQADPMRPQHQSFPLSPTWDSSRPL
jgi:hypothetical protein